MHEQGVRGFRGRGVEQDAVLANNGRI